jgi:uncharacterized protein YecE (DUF72 family)
MKARPKLCIGTSGWSYDHWTGTFYPEDLSAGERLAYYAERLVSVEINKSFYSLPTEKALDTWQATVPDRFVFAVKASRYITHMKKLKDPEQGVGRFLPRMQLLGDKLGPILFQLPPHWRFNAERLESFLAGLSRAFRYTIELRDPSWINDQALEILTRFDVAFTIYDLAGYLSPKEVTTDFVYVRLHGPNGPYRGCYSTQSLAGWAGAVSAWLARGLRVYCYFDNDEAGHAARNALELQAMLEEA